MTRKIIQTLQILATASTIFSLTGVNTLANRVPDQVADRTSTPIPIDRAEPVLIAFAYGNIATDVDIENALAEIKINGTDLEFVTTAFEDWYFGNPNRADSDANIPQQPSCNSSYSGPKYKISPSLATANSIKYGFQSARDKDKPSGSNEPGVLDIPDRSSTIRGLREKHTGCIKVEFKVSSTAKVGSTTEIIFEPDALKSPTYSTNEDTGESTRPARQVARFQIGEPKDPNFGKQDPVVEKEEEKTPTPTKNFKEELPRSGGSAIIAGLSLIAFSIIGFIGYRVKRKDFTKIDLN
jgi:hypothetical protein